ncbi:hypothetical protein [Agrobacterium rosae]|uniref:Uncharacterized protein n=1 Tax=Agrobacterium rosae TaxID=1972867 RepID=A0A1R3TXS7_9HYPH|nr:hypothetical protein [Agrobacterium rosae]SCX31693.1 hypothetical protein DSM25559_3784 [Agrobacterium rosae]
MIDVAALKPTDIEDLSEAALTEQDKSELLSSVLRMLTELAPDNGANSDRIFMSAQMLDMAGVWAQISPKELAKTLLASGPSARRPFIEGLPHDFAAEVSLAIVTEPEIVETTTTEMAEYLSAVESKLQVVGVGREADNLGLADILASVRLSPAPSVVAGDPWAVALFKKRIESTAIGGHWTFSLVTMTPHVLLERMREVERTRLALLITEE